MIIYTVNYMFMLRSRDVTFAVAFTFFVTIIGGQKGNGNGGCNGNGGGMIK